MREIRRNIVAALIVSKDRKVFLGMKDINGGGVYADCWHIPGGGVNDGETNGQALVREIKEETGIDISRYGIELIDDIGEGESDKVLDTGEKVLCRMKFNVYRVDISDRLAEDIGIVLGDDLARYEWVGMPDLKDKKLTPPSMELFGKIGYLA